jgi:hypothetical protein
MISLPKIIGAIDNPKTKINLSLENVACPLAPNPSHRAEKNVAQRIRGTNNIQIIFQCRA